MSINDPDQLVAEFKKSGEFDRLRRVLLTQFKKDNPSNSSLVTRVEDIVRQRLTSDAKLFNMGNDALHAELMQEMDRYPLVDRAVAEVPSFSDPNFQNGIRASLAAILSREDGKNVDLDESDTSGSESDNDEEQTTAATKNEHRAQRPGSPSGTRNDKNKNERAHESDNEDPNS